MAGFTGNSRSYSNNPNPVTRALRKLSSFGMNYKDDVIKNVRSVDLLMTQQNISNCNTNSTQIGTINDDNVSEMVSVIISEIATVNGERKIVPIKEEEKEMVLSVYDSIRNA